MSSTGASPNSAEAFDAGLSAVERAQTQTIGWKPDQLVLESRQYVVGGFGYAVDVLFGVGGGDE
jgi:hypothetical protein